MIGLLLLMIAMMHHMLVIIVLNTRGVTLKIMKYVYFLYLIFDNYSSYFPDNGPYWISYDDSDSVALKTKYANFLNLAGSFGWSLETDDFEGRYFDQNYPLLRVSSKSRFYNIYVPHFYIIGEKYQKELIPKNYIIIFTESK